MPSTSRKEVSFLLLLCSSVGIKCAVQLDGEARQSWAERPTLADCHQLREGRSFFCIGQCRSLSTHMLHIANRQMCAEEVSELCGW